MRAAQSPIMIQVVGKKKAVHLERQPRQSHSLKEGSTCVGESMFYVPGRSRRSVGDRMEKVERAGRARACDFFFFLARYPNTNPNCPCNPGTCKSTCSVHSASPLGQQRKVEHFFWGASARLKNCSVGRRVRFILSLAECNDTYCTSPSVRISTRYASRT